MKRDFKDFNQQPGSGQKATACEGMDAEQAAAFAKRYEGMDQNQIMGEILKEAAVSRQNGNFDPEGIRQFAEQLRPGLNAAQRQQLDMVLRQLGIR